MAETDFEMDSNQKRKSNANFRIFMPRVNSDPEFDWQFCTFSIQNLKCHPEDEMCPWKFCTTFILVDFLVFRKNWRMWPKFHINTWTSRGLSPLARVLTN
jgi:hypothetical protein